MINPYLAAMFLSVTVASFSQILLKKSAMKTYESPIREYLNIWVISGWAFGLFYVDQPVGIRWSGV